MTDKTPATKTATKTRKRPTITTPRLYNAVENIVNEAGLGIDQTISELYDVFEKVIVKEARA